MKMTFLKWIICVLFLGSTLIIPVTAQAGVTEIHDINILNVFISEKYLECKKDLHVSIQLRNEGIENEYVHAEIINQELGIDEFAPILMIQPKGLESVSIPVTLEEEPKGSYEFEVLVYFNNEVKRYFNTFEFEGCPEPPAHQTSLNFASEPQSTKTSEQVMSAQIWYIIGMMIIIFILAVIYLLKIYIEKARSRE